jgi:hypothetical protein
MRRHVGAHAGMSVFTAKTRRLHVTASWPHEEEPSMRTHTPFLASAWLLLFACGTARADAILHVGTGAGCEHATIQAAINAADNADGTTWIHITRTLAYTNQQLDIAGKNVVLTGGYADCQQVVEDETRTQLSGINGTVRPVITVRGSTQFVGIYKLDISGNHNTNPGAGAGLGGAIAVLGGPHRLVDMGLIGAMPLTEQVAMIVRHH